VIESTNKIWRLTGIYGEPRWEDKFKTWGKMRELKHSNNLPWIILGDFNEIIDSTEKKGGNPRPQGYVDAFHDAIMDRGLEDLGSSGDAFMWKRGRIHERLDRAIANVEWMGMNPSSLVQHLDFIKYDHHPILVNTDAQFQHSTSKQRRFKARWLQAKGFQEKVQQAWDSVSTEPPTDNVLTKLNKLHGALHEWDANVLQKPKKRIKAAQQKSEKAMNGPMNGENEAVAKEMAELIHLKHGGRNTNFFIIMHRQGEKKTLSKDSRMIKMSGLKVLIS
jgi:hypothetical protein